jgi:hypothetical protein
MRSSSMKGSAAGKGGRNRQHASPTGRDRAPSLSGLRELLSEVH